MFSLHKVPLSGKHYSETNRTSDYSPGESHSPLLAVLPAPTSILCAQPPASRRICNLPAPFRSQRLSYVTRVPAPFIAWQSRFIPEMIAHSKCGEWRAFMPRAEEAFCIVMYGDANPECRESRELGQRSLWEEVPSRVPVSFHVTCFSVLQSHFFFCVLCLWGWPDSLESAWSPVVLLCGALVRLCKKQAKINLSKVWPEPIDSRSGSAS